MTHEIIRHFSQIKLPNDIKLVILDFDNTCYIYEPCHESAILAVKNWFEKEISSSSDFLELYKEAQKIVKSRIPNQGASHSRILYFKTMLEKIKNSNSIQNSLLMEDIYWKIFMENMKPVPGLMNFLNDCKINKITVAIVSDLTTKIQCEKITSLGISNFVDVLVTSEEAGVEKPDPYCFKVVLDKTGFSVTNTIVIGDSFERDIIGAQALGTKSILITH